MYDIGEHELANPKLDPELKRQWVEALRSGKYKQAKHKLRSEDGFCCLGVACDVIAPKGVKTTWELIPSKSCYQFYASDDLEATNSSEVLPITFSRAIGLEKLDITFKLDKKDAKIINDIIQGPNKKSNKKSVSENGLATATWLNDEGVPFNIIADLIEKYL